MPFPPLSHLQSCKYNICSSLSHRNIKRWEGGSGWGTRAHPWQIHVDVWQNQYNTVKLKKEKERKKC